MNTPRAFPSFLVASIFLCITFSQAQTTVKQEAQFSSLERERALEMFKTISSDVKKRYYDPKFHGLDWDARVLEARGKIEVSKSQNEALANIANVLAALNDSHTFFLPPTRPYVHDYGFQFEMIGDHCLITRVRPGSDAERKGVEAGDELLTLNGYVPTRENMWQMDYVIHSLRPQLSLRLELVSPAGVRKQVEAVAKFRELRRVKDLSGEDSGDIWDLYRALEDARNFWRLSYQEYSRDLMILKVPRFEHTQEEIENVIGIARKHKNLIIDLRENGGGSLETLKYVLSGIFDHEIKIADLVGRRGTKPLIEKFHPHNPFVGRLAVLIDSKSASASEIFARVVQLEGRGPVIGDRSAGSVMEAQQYSYAVGMGISVFYGASITEADVIMSDGKSLEHVGVVPDETVLPTAWDLAIERDPALARAAELLGVKISKEYAGKFFPYEWPKVE